MLRRSGLAAKDSTAEGLTNAMHLNTIECINRQTVTAMTERSVPLSARISSDDAAFLAGVRIEAAVTPSDKLRAIISQARKQSEGSADYASSLQWIRDLLAPALTRIRAAEHPANMHSEIVTLAMEWLPQIMALSLSVQPTGKDAPKKLEQFEEALTQRCFQLFESLLRLGVTSRAAAYNGGVISSRLAPILELAQIVSASRKPKKE